MFRLRFHADGHGDREVAAPFGTQLAPEKLHENSLGTRPPGRVSFDHPSARPFASASISLLRLSSVDFTRAFTAGSSAALATFSLANR